MPNARRATNQRAATRVGLAALGLQGERVARGRRAPRSSAMSPRAETSRASLFVRWRTEHTAQTEYLLKHCEDGADNARKDDVEDFRNVPAA